MSPSKTAASRAASRWPTPLRPGHLARRHVPPEARASMNDDIRTRGARVLCGRRDAPGTVLRMRVKECSPCARKRRSGLRGGGGRRRDRLTVNGTGNVPGGATFHSIWPPHSLRYYARPRRAGTLRATIFPDRTSFPDSDAHDQPRRAIPRRDRRNDHAIADGGIGKGTLAKRIALRYDCRIR